MNNYPIYTNICDFNFNPLYQDFEIESDEDFDKIESLVLSKAAPENPKCIRWTRPTDGFLGYWGPSGVQRTPYWYK